MLKYLTMQCQSVWWGPVFEPVGLFSVDLVSERYGVHDFWSKNGHMLDPVLVFISNGEEYETPQLYTDKSKIQYPRQIETKYPNKQEFPRIR